jgi:hypothetical protein
MSKSNIEWQRQYVIKYSNINKMKNGLRKVYFYENDCKHQRNSLEEIDCPMCRTEFECCDKCYMDFTESGVKPETYEDLICPDCLEQCKSCQKFITDDNGSRADTYPYDLYCNDCSNDMGVAYDNPDELEQPNEDDETDENNETDVDNETDEENEDTDEETDDDTEEDEY